MKIFSNIALVSSLFGAATLAAPTGVGEFEKRDAFAVEIFPNYLVPINQSSPDRVYNTQNTFRIEYSGNDATNNEVRMFVGFDVPDYGPTKCALRLTIPAPMPGGYPNAVTGTGRLDVHGLIGFVNPAATTWNMRPTRYPNTPLWTVYQPLNYGDAVVAGPAIPCNRGQRMDFEVLADRPGATFFDFFELTTPKTGWTMLITN